jgi:hypothetical protein
MSFGCGEGILKHLELEKPVSLVEWEATLLATDSTTTFHRYADVLFDQPGVRMTRELQAIVDDFGSAALDAVYSVRGMTISGVWIDPHHNYIAVELSRALGDDEDGVITTSLMQR